jgi:hypothetical protein
MRVERTSILKTNVGIVNGLMANLHFKNCRRLPLLEWGTIRSIVDFLGCSFMGGATNGGGNGRSFLTFLYMFDVLGEIAHV